MVYTVSSALALRFDQIGVWHHFAGARHVFLNQLLINKDLKQINRTNALNFCFNAPGYARAPGAARRLAPTAAHVVKRI
jgi:TPP-dependent 2-oxoacid decarboxylase